MNWRVKLDFNGVPV